MKTYIQKNAGYFEMKGGLGENFPDYGSTWEDYLDGKWVELGEQQLAFRDSNPTATIKEVWDMELVPPPTPPTIEELRTQAIQLVEQTAIAKKAEMYPPEVLIAKAYSSDADENAFYFDGFMDFSERIENAVDVAIQAINNSEYGMDVNGAVDEFNQIISML